MEKIRMLQNLHTHTQYCDGRNTPREMIERAIELGFISLGFSSHANTIVKQSCELGARVDDYKREITSLKAEYSDRIKIFLGTELDVLSEGCVDCSDYDYKICSVHFGVKDGNIVCYDESVEHSENAIRTLFGGNGLEYARLYFETMADMPNHISGDFVGHFDLLTKYEQIAPHLFDTGSRLYRKYALEALCAVREKFEFFEINTGTIGRGYKTTPYPAPFIFDEMRALKCKLLITTDCHNKDYLDCGFNYAVELMRAHGFDELYELCDTGFVGRRI